MARSTSLDSTLKTLLMSRLRRIISQQCLLSVIITIVLIGPTLTAPSMQTHCESDKIEISSSITHVCLSELTY
jgi:hypothetical protein